MASMIGQTIGGYQILEQIGQGGMATIYKAHQPALDRYVALKILPRHLAQESGFEQRFRREARAAAKLEHPHILPIFDFGQQDEIFYIALRYVPAGTLKERMGQPLPLEFIAGVVSQVAEALDYAHEQGVVHRDIKPSNILLDRGDWALLSDFGVARIVESTEHITSTGVGVGTPAYMSPEQGMGKKVDGRSDIYSLGVVFYEMLTGQVPYQADTPMAVVLKHIHDPLPRPREINRTIPEAVERVVLKSLAKSPEDRFHTAGDLAEALRSVSREAAVRKGRPSELEATTDLALEARPTPLPRARLARWVWLLLAFVGVAGLGWLVGQLSSADWMRQALGLEAPLTPAPTLAPVTPVPTRAPLPTVAPAALPAEPQGPSARVCMITDSGGINDRSFNATIWAGVEIAMDTLNVDGWYTACGGEEDYAPNIASAIESQCDLVVAVGFSMAEELEQAARSHPEQRFSIVDIAYDPPHPNVVGQVYEVDEAALLAGYIAAGVTRTGRVATWGGAPVPTVTDFMDGFARGVRLYNERHGTAVDVLGWNPEQQTGLFGDTFVDADVGRRIGEELLDQGADVILPVAGSAGFGTADVALARGNAYVIGVDSDWFVAVPQYRSIVLTSVLKRMDVTTLAVIQQLVEGNFTGGTYVGMLANRGVDIAPFHDLQGLISAQLREELEALRQAIIAGEIRTTP